MLLLGFALLCAVALPVVRWGFVVSDFGWSLWAILWVFY